MHSLNETTAFKIIFGEVAEWSIAPVLKTDVLKGTGGSNPSLSARKRKLRLPFFALEGMRTPEWGFVIDEVACQSKNPSLSAKRKADRNSNLFEGLSAFSFCKDARGSARDGRSQSLSLSKSIASLFIFIINQFFGCKNGV